LKIIKMKKNLSRF